MADERAGWVEAGKVAAVVMVSTERLRQLAKEGFIPKAVKGRYPLIPVVQGYIRFLKDEERRTSKVQAESSLKQARQREIEMRIAREDHKVIDTDEAIGVLDEILGNLKAGMVGVPASVTRDLDLRRKIAAEIDGVFTRSHALFAQRAQALRASGEAGAAVSEDDV